MANEKIQTINDVSQAPERMTGAMYKHFVTKENVSIIDERHACVRNGVPCIYAPPSGAVATAARRRVKSAPLPGG